MKSVSNFPRFPPLTHSSPPSNRNARPISVQGISKTLIWSWLASYSSPLSLLSWLLRSFVTWSPSLLIISPFVRSFPQLHFKNPYSNHMFNTPISHWTITTWFYAASSLLVHSFSRWFLMFLLIDYSPLLIVIVSLRVLVCFILCLPHVYKGLSFAHSRQAIRFTHISKAHS